jgi:hypothetical protein
MTLQIGADQILYVPHHFNENAPQEHANGNLPYPALYSLATVFKFGFDGTMMRRF